MYRVSDQCIDDMYHIIDMIHKTSYNHFIVIVVRAACLFLIASYREMWRKYVPVPAHQTSDMSGCTISTERSSKLEMVILSSLRFLTI